MKTLFLSAVLCNLNLIDARPINSPQANVIVHAETLLENVVLPKLPTLPTVREESVINHSLLRNNPASSLLASIDASRHSSSLFPLQPDSIAAHEDVLVSPISNDQLKLDEMTLENAATEGDTLELENAKAENVKKMSNRAARKAEKAERLARLESGKVESQRVILDETPTPDLGVAFKADMERREMHAARVLEKKLKAIASARQRLLDTIDDSLKKYIDVPIKDLDGHLVSLESIDMALKRTDVQLENGFKNGGWRHNANYEQFFKPPGKNQKYMEANIDLRTRVIVLADTDRRGNALFSRFAGVVQHPAGEKRFLPLLVTTEAEGPATQQLVPSNHLVVL